MLSQIVTGVFSRKAPSSASLFETDALRFETLSRCLQSSSTVMRAFKEAVEYDVHDMVLGGLSTHKHDAFVQALICPLTHYGLSREKAASAAKELSRFAIAQIYNKDSEFGAVLSGQLPKQTETAPSPANI